MIMASAESGSTDRGEVALGLAHDKDIDQTISDLRKEIADIDPTLGLEATEADQVLFERFTRAAISCFRNKTR